MRTVRCSGRLGKGGRVSTMGGVCPGVFAQEGSAGGLPGGVDRMTDLSATDGKNVLKV